jgi:hypothetical protein
MTSNTYVITQFAPVFSYKNEYLIFYFAAAVFGS